MKIDGIIWLEEVIEKLFSKNNVTQQEVEESLNNKTHYRFVEKGNNKNENVYSAFGQTFNGRYLMVFFIYKINKCVLIISARDMTDRERKYYEKK